MRARILPLLIGVIYGTPATALACPSCSASLREQTKKAFVDTWILLTFAPLLMIGGVAFWIWRRTRTTAE